MSSQTINVIFAFLSTCSSEASLGHVSLLPSRALRNSCPGITRRPRALRPTLSRLHGTHIERHIPSRGLGERCEGRCANLFGLMYGKHGRVISDSGTAAVAHRTLQARRSPSGVTADVDAWSFMEICTGPAVVRRLRYRKARQQASTVGYTHN